MRDRVLRPGIEPGRPALGTQSLTHWTTREVPWQIFNSSKIEIYPPRLYSFLQLTPTSYTKEIKPYPVFSKGNLSSQILSLDSFRIFKNDFKSTDNSCCRINIAYKCKVFRILTVDSCFWNFRSISIRVAPLYAFVLKCPTGEFPGGPVVRTLHFHCRGHGFNPWSGN